MTLTPERFIQIYSNLPLGVRREIIVVIDSKPITWNAAFIEINGKTSFGTQILKKLEDIGILGE